MNDVRKSIATINLITGLDGSLSCLYAPPPGLALFSCLERIREWSNANC